MFTNYMKGFSFEAAIGKKPPTPAPCWDQIYGKLDRGNFIPLNQLERKNIFYTLNGTQRTIANKISNHSIVIILESPHKDEYKESGAANGPAFGPTGTCFNKHFKRLITAKDIGMGITTGVYDVILINAVQYQCTFGETIDSKFRDYNWLNCFEKGCAEDLICRLEALQPEILINACTKSDANLQLAVHTTIFLHRAMGKTLFSKYIYGTHPITWTSKTETMRRKW